MRAKKIVFEETAKEREKDRAAVDVMGRYLLEVRKLKIFTSDEEKTLTEKIRRGDARAREAMINANLRIAINIARRYHYRITHLKLGDLVSAANEGLINAVDRFKPLFKCRFSTYATYWIVQALEREIMSYEYIIRTPANVSYDLGRYKKKVSSLTNKIGRIPTIEEIAMEMKKTVEWVKEKQQTISKKYVSLDEPFAGCEDGKNTASFGSFIAGSDGTESYRSVLSSERKEKFTNLLSSVPLSEQEKNVLFLRYGIGSDDGEGLTLDKIGSRLGVTRERVRQIETRALKKLRNKKYRELLIGMQ